MVRGGSWDDDADKLRTARGARSNPEWSIQDPDRPQSIWWHTDATFVGFRIVRPLVEQENLRGLKSQVVKGRGSVEEGEKVTITSRGTRQKQAARSDAEGGRGGNPHPVRI